MTTDTEDKAPPGREDVPGGAEEAVVEAPAGHRLMGEGLARTLEWRIVYLKLKPGAHLTEQEVSDEFGVSRSPVREAFRQLEADGLVTRLAHRGIRVNRMSLTDLDEIYACRIALEGLAAAGAARRAGPEDVAAMRAAVDGMAAALAAGDVDRFFHHNVAFQGRVHAASGNRMLMRVLAVMEKQALRYRYFAHSRSPKMLAFSHGTQEAVLATIERGDEAVAKRSATAMMRRAHRLIGDIVRKHLDELGGA